MNKQENIQKAQDALRMIESGENPLDNYETVKMAILESQDAIEVLWSMLSPKMIENLKKNKECNKIIKEYKKSLKEQLNEVSKEFITFKYRTSEEYEKWADNAKDTPLTRRTKFIYEVVWPIMADLFDKLFFEIEEMGEHGKLSRTTAPCPECNNVMTYRKLKDKMVCEGCGLNEELSKISGKKTEPIDAVVYDMMNLPNKEAIARQMAGILDPAINDYLKQELKKKK